MWYSDELDKFSFVLFVVLEICKKFYNLFLFKKLKKEVYTKLLVYINNLTCIKVHVNL